MTKDAATTVRRGTVFGSGLALTDYVAVLLTSVALFASWDGLLWLAEPRSSHGMRFVVSYVTVVPMVALLLARRRRFSWSTLAASVFTLWGIKLVITAPMYYALAPGGALEDIGAIKPAQTTTTAARPGAKRSTPIYRAAAGAFEHGSIAGRVAGAPGVVRLEAPNEGAALDEGKVLTIVLSERGFDEQIELATVTDQLVIRNDGSALHTVQIAKLLNAPVPQGMATHPLELAQSELHTLRCAAHAAEHGALLVVDHPYATRTDNGGAFVLNDVPTGQQRVEALAIVECRVVRGHATVNVHAGETSKVELSLGDDTKPKENRL
jgi:hypothetical protein